MALIVSVSGVRGIVGEELTPEIIFQFVSAFAHQFPGRLAVGRDSRPSGREFKSAAIDAIRAAGHTAIDLDILPTPTFGLLVRQYDCTGGIQITASHNPAPYNGLKFFGPDGAVIASGFDPRKFNKDQGSLSARGEIISHTSAWKQHAHRVLELTDIDTVRKAQFSVVVDANGGAGGPLAMGLLNDLGCRITPVGCIPDGDFQHEPEPTPNNLRSIETIVRQNPKSFGVCLDPDADRLVMIDESGTCLNEELTLALAIQSRLRKSKGPVVINLSTSRVTEDVARAAGVPCFRSSVGEANVVAKMREVDALIGGEGNGGVIDPRVGWVRDPFIGIGLVLEMMAETNQTLKQLVFALPKYVIRKDKIPLAFEHLHAGLNSLKKHWSDSRINESDGVRFDWPDYWVHVRASNTEPIARIIAESRDDATNERLLAQVREILQST